MQFAAVFPGQGSQSVGMLSELSESFTEVKDTFQEASEALGKDLWAITKQEDTITLNQTENTQPIMLAAGISVWRIWLRQGGCLPIGMAGHSLGEYSALVASGVIGYTDAIKVVFERATLMQEAVPGGAGAMAAILGLDDKIIVKVCDDSKEKGIVEAVNFNSPGQVVIAGEVAAVDYAIEKLIEAGAKRAIKLPVSVPSHCSLLKEASEKLKITLEKTVFSESKFPVLQNFLAKNLNNTKERKDALSKQLYKPVLWVDTINNLQSEQGADTIIEFGPGKVLFGLNRRINRTLGNICVSDNSSLEKALKLCIV